MSRLTPEGSKIAAEIAQRHGVSSGAVETLLVALANGHGTQAQFDHPDLGGMGQWSRGGMTMVGDMFNNALKAKVDALCAELSQVLSENQVFAAAERPASSQSQYQGSGTSFFVAGSGFGGNWWPAELGAPSSTGAQNDMRYAVFPQTRRLAIQVAGNVEIFDTADHRITGVSQQQSGDQSLTFVSQNGLVKVADLTRIPASPGRQPDAVKQPGSSPETPAAEEQPADISPSPASASARPSPATQDTASSAKSAEPQPSSSSTSSEEIISLIRKLAELRESGILTDAEFEAKKAELLARL